MKYSPILAAVAAAAMFIGCANTTTKDHYRATPAVGIKSVVFQPQVEVIEGKTAVGTASGKSIFWIFTTEAPENRSNNLSSGAIGFLSSFEDPIRAAAVYNACEAAGADILLAPRFTESRKSVFLGFKEHRTVTVKGIPAKIVGAKEVKE